MYLLEHHAEARARFASTGVKARLSPLRDVISDHPDNAQLKMFVDKICRLVDGTEDRTVTRSVANEINKSDSVATPVRRDPKSSITLCQIFLDLITPYTLVTLPLLLGCLAWKAYATAHSQPIANTLDWIISIVFFTVCVCHTYKPVFID